MNENQRNRGNPAIEGLFARKAERAHTVGTGELEADLRDLTCVVFDSTRWGRGGWVAHRIKLSSINTQRNKPLPSVTRGGSRSGRQTPPSEFETFHVAHANDIDSVIDQDAIPRRKVHVDN